MTNKTVTMSRELAKELLGCCTDPETYEALRVVLADKSAPFLVVDETQAFANWMSLPGDKTAYYAWNARAILAAPVVERQEPVGEVADMKYNRVQFYRATGDTSKPYLLPGTKIYTSPPAPVAVDAAKAFAKGFNTLESAEGKYKIIMQFAGRDDAWAAYKALSHMTSAIDKVKELNQ